MIKTINPIHLLIFCWLAIFIFSCEEEPFTCEPDYTSCDTFGLSVDSLALHRKVFIIGIDGFRADAMQAGISPFLYQFSLEESTFYNAKHRVMELTFSGPNWSSLLTGVDVCKHRVTTNNFRKNNLVEYPHFFSYLEAAQSDLVTASVVDWRPINKHLAGPYADYAPLDTLNDFEVYHQTSELLLDQNPVDPDVLFIQFDELDGAGHDFGFSPDEPFYALTLTRLDAYIAELIAIIEARRVAGEDWIIFIVSDHGGEGRGHGDGADNPNIRNTIFFVNHPELEFITGFPSSQVDMVPTILDFMGIESEEYNCKADGISLLN